MIIVLLFSFLATNGPGQTTAHVITGRVTKGERVTIVETTPVQPPTKAGEEPKQLEPLRNVLVYLLVDENVTSCASVPADMKPSAVTDAEGKYRVDVTPDDAGKGPRNVRLHFCPPRRSELVPIPEVEGVLLSQGAAETTHDVELWERLKEMTALQGQTSILVGSLLRANAGDPASAWSSVKNSAYPTAGKILFAQSLYSHTDERHEDALAELGFDVYRAAKADDVHRLESQLEAFFLLNSPPDKFAALELDAELTRDIARGLIQRGVGTQALHQAGDRWQACGLDPKIYDVLEYDVKRLPSRKVPQ